MNVQIKLILIICLLPVYLFSQEFSKETIYLNFLNQKDCSRKMKFYSKDEKGLIFNLFCKKNGTFLFKNTSKSDTLSLFYLKDYKINSTAEIEKIEKDWRNRNKKKLIDKYGFPYPRFDKNGIFNTFIIEILENQNKFVIYPVIWRNQGIVD